MQQLLKEKPIRIKKEMEYEEAPSGYVTLYNYKEPFMKFQEGTGYLGVLLFDGETDKVQCHFCGTWHTELGNHLHREHNMTAKAYKEKTGLRQSTALIGEILRAKLIASGLTKRLQNIRPGYGPMSQEQKDKIATTLRANAIESQNERNTCDDQLPTRLRKIYDKLGRTPSQRLGEIPFYETLMKRYGSMKRACELAEIPYREHGTHINNTKEYTREICKAWSKEFIIREKRLPRITDYQKDKKTGIYINILKYGKTKLFREIYAELRKPKEQKQREQKDELIKELQIFKEINGRKPSYSDAKRKLIPSLQKYIYHFKSWQNALAIAFPGEEIKIERKKGPYKPKWAKYL